MWKTRSEYLICCVEDLTAIDDIIGAQIWELSFSSRPLAAMRLRLDERRTPITSYRPGPGPIRECGGSGRARANTCPNYRHEVITWANQRRNEITRQHTEWRERDGARRAKSHLLFEFKISFLALIYTHGDSSYFLTAFRMLWQCVCGFSLRIGFLSRFNGRAWFSTFHPKKRSFQCQIVL